MLGAYRLRIISLTLFTLRRANNMGNRNLYSSGAWQKLRKHFLMNNPLCDFCLVDGRFTQATVVDHIIPHKGNMKIFLEGPFQALCETHHNSTKQREEKSGSKVGGDVKGEPFDPKHHWNC